MTQIIVETLDVLSTYVATQAACVYSLTAATEMEIVLDVTKKLCYICFNYDTEETYGLPDRNIITFGAKRFPCAEVLLQPNFIGKRASRFRDTSFQFILMLLSVVTRMSGRTHGDYRRRDSKHLLFASMIS